MTRSVRDASPVDFSTYPALNFEGLELRANYRLIAFREDVLHALDHKEAAAIIVQILLRWHEYLRDDLLEKIEQRSKRGLAPLSPDEIEDRMWVYMSYARFVRESGGAIGYNTVIRALEYLVETKHVVERRLNQNPNTVDYADYEYRINRAALRNLLKKLPLSPQRSSRKGKPAQTMAASQPDAPGGESPSTQTGTLCDDEPDDTFPSTQTGTPSHMDPSTAHLGTHPTQTGMPSSHKGRADCPNGQTIQRILQDVSQESFQQQQRESGNDVCIPHAPAAVFEPGSLSPDESALVLARRRGMRPGENESPHAQSVLHHPLPDTSAESDALAAAETPARELAWTGERLLSAFETRRGAPYDPAIRVRQLTATARMTAYPLPSGLYLPPDAASFETFYEFINDRWTQEHFGEPTPIYLMEPDKASGQPRLVRLLARFAAQARAAGGGATMQPTSEQQAGLRPIIGVSGRPVFVPSAEPLTVLPPPPRERRRPGLMAAGRRG